MNDGHDCAKLEEELAWQQAEVDRLNAKLDKWEREEVEKASCCMENEERAAKAEAEVARLKADRDRYTKELDDYMRTIAAEQRLTRELARIHAQAAALRAALEEVGEQYETSTLTCDLRADDDGGWLAVMRRVHDALATDAGFPPERESKCMAESKAARLGWLSPEQAAELRAELKQARELSVSRYDNWTACLTQLHTERMQVDALKEAVREACAIAADDDTLRGLQTAERIRALDLSKVKP